MTLLLFHCSSAANRFPGRSPGHYYCASTIIIIILQVLQQQSAYAAVYIQANETYYPSLPGLFGGFMADNRLYQARMQFISENPFLCDSFDSNMTYFVPKRPTPVTSTNNDSKKNNSDSSNNDDNDDYDDDHENSSDTNNEYILPAEPIALLASRGNCTFARKAAVAESIHPSVQFLIVYNTELEQGDDTLFSLAAEEDEDTRLILLSVSYRTGQALQQYLGEQPEAVRQQQGGPLIFITEMDNPPPLDTPSPTGMSTVDVVLEIVLSIVAFLGCTDCAMRFCKPCRDSIDLPDNSSSPVVGAQTSRPATEDTVAHDGDARRKVADVLQLPQVAATEKAAHFGDDDDTTLICPICLDDEVPKAISVLPCQHRFHTECIVPWLTERHANCPLCKYDMRQYVSDHEAAAAAAV